MIRKLIFVCLLLAGSLSAQTNFYVSNTGNDSNNGAQATPWKTIQHAIETVPLSGAVVINVAAGTYTNPSPQSCQGNDPLVCIDRGGPSDSARLTLQCSAQWSVPAGSGCVLRQASGFSTFIQVNANNVNVFGFDAGNNAAANQGIQIGCYPKTGTGSCATGNNVTIQNNYVHELAQTANDAGHGPGCPANGAIFVGHSGAQVPTNVKIIGNRVYYYGDWASQAPINGGNCTFAHDIYASANTIIQNNILLNATSNGIQLYDSPCNAVITNNTIARSGTNGIQIAGGGGACTAGRVTATNNILDNNGRWGLLVGTGSGGACDATHQILISSNITSGNGNAPYSGTSACSNPVNQLTEAPATTFVNYTGTSTDNLHIKAGSVAISGGISTCVPSGITPCVASIDFDNVVRPASGAQSNGAYVFVSAGVPIPTFSPSPLAFGSVAVSTPSLLVATLRNTGGANLTFSTAATISGTNAADFKITSTTCTSPLAAAASCTYNITFTPAAAGARAANLTLNDNASGSPHQLPLTGTGGTAGITFTPTSLSFGVIAPGSSSAVQLFTMTNTGSLPLNVTSATIVGTNASEFGFGGQGSCSQPQTYAPGASCKISIRFNPTTAGAKTAAVSLVTNVPGSPQTVPLTGTGGASSLSLAPLSIACGTQQVGTSVSCPAFTLTATGTLNSTGIAISIVGATPAAYSQSNNCPANGTLAPAATCTINIFFKPVAAGAQNATLQVTSNSAPLTAPLSGTGTAPPTISLSPATVNFNNVTVGSTSAASVVTLKNNGSVTVNLTSITTASPFTKSATTCGATLAAGISCTVSVTATPTVNGVAIGSLTVVDNATGSPHVASLSVNGVSPTNSFTPASIAFGNQALNTQTAARNFTLANTGTGPMTFALSLAGTDPTQFVLLANSCISPLAAGASCIVPVAFKPTGTGAKTATVRSTDSASGSPHDVTVTGTGVATAPALCLSVTSVDFSNQPVGTTSGSRPIVETNCGTANLVVSAITPTGNFSSTGGTGTITPGATSVINATFSPLAAGALTGNLSIASNAASSPDLVTLAGFGTQTGATIAISPGANFGSVTVGASSTPATVTVTNTGNLSLPVSATTVTGSNAADFVAGSCPANLAPNSTCQYGVVFTPSGAGSRSATLTQPFGSGVSSLTIGLSGTGVATAPAVTFTPTSFNFGNVTQSVASASKTAQVQNSGTSALTITSVTKTGTNSADYTITNHCPITPSTLAAGAVCTVDVTVTPGSTGARTANIHLIDDAADTPQDLPMTVNGVASPTAKLTLSTASVAFSPPSITTGTTSQAMTVTGTNTGNANLNFTSIALAGSNPGDFAFSPNSAVSDIEGFPDLGGHPASCATTAAWCFQHDSGTGGTSTGSTSLVTVPSASGQSRRFDISWTSFGGERFSIYLGANNLDTNSSRFAYSANVYVTNLAHVHALEFDLNQVLADGTTVIYGNQCNFDVGFWQYTTNVAGNAVWNSTTVPCLRSDWVASPAPNALRINFHRNSAGAVTYDSVTFNGTTSPYTGANGNSDFSLGWTPLGLLQVNFQIDGDSTSNSTTVYLDLLNITSLGGNCATVTPGNSCSVDVNFVPTTAGSRSATLVFTSNAASSPDSVALAGTGITGTPNVTLAVSNINFNNCTVGTVCGPAAFTLTNTGTATATGVAITAGGDFSVTDGCGGSITAGSSCTASVSFAPNQLCGQFAPNDPSTCISNVHLGTVSVVSNTSNSPQQVTLQGTAVAVPPPPGPIVMTLGGKIVVGGHLQVGIQ